MKKQVLFGVVVLGLMMCLASVPARAQGGGDIFVGYSYLLDNFNAPFFCGSSISGCFDPGRHGYNVAVTWNFNPNIGLEANFSGNHGTTTVYSDVGTGTEAFTDLGKQSSDTVTALFGPRLSHAVGNSNFSIYTHFLVGVMHVHESFTSSCSTCGGTDNPFADNFKGTGFGMKVGGGADWHHGHWGIRILEVDYVHGDGQGTFTCTDCTDKIGGTGGVKDVQMATGFLFRWGGTQ